MSSRAVERSHIASAAVFLARFSRENEDLFRHLFQPQPPSPIPPFISTSVSQPRRDVGPRGWFKSLQFERLGNADGNGEPGE